MKANKILLFITIVFLGVLVAVAGCAEKKQAVPGKQEQPKTKQITMRFSHVVSPESTKGKAIQHFADLVEQYTNGRVKVNIFPSGQLYSDAEEVEAVLSGNVELITPGATKIVTLEPSYNVWSLMFLFPNYKVMCDFVEDPQGWGKLSKNLEKKTGLMELGFIPSGMAHWFNNKRPINSPEDLKGLKLRSVGGSVVNEQVALLGGSGVTLPFGEVYNALQLGTVDGGETNIANIYTMKFYEVSKYLTLSSHSAVGWPIVINKKFYDTLPSDIQDALKKAGKEAQNYAFDIVAEEEKSFIEKIKASGKTQINELTPEQRANFEKKVHPIWEKYKKVIGEDVFQRVMELRSQ